MKKLRILPLLIIGLLVSCQNESNSSNGLSSNSSSNNTSLISSHEEVTKITDFEFEENSDGTLSIKKYKNYLPKRVILPDTYQNKKITGILSAAFSSSGGIETIVISRYIENIDKDAFISCLTITSFEVDENNINFIAKDGILYNKKGDELVFCPTKKDNVEVLNNVKKIRDGAFQYYRGKNIKLNEGLEEIGSFSFSSSAFLEKITIPNSVKKMGESAFNLSGIKSIILGSGISSLEDSTFYKCSNLESLIIPGNIKVIKDGAICYNTKLKTLTFEDGVETIESGACTDNSEVSLSLPTSLKSIGDNAFIRNANLSEVNIPEGVKSIGSGAFSYCEQIKKISISSTVESIGYSLMAYDKNLKTIEVSNDNKYFTSSNNVLYSHDLKRLLVFPALHEVTEFEVQDNVTTIDREAFTYLIRLTKLILPKSISFIGALAFRESNALTDFNYSGSKDDFKKITYKEVIGEEEVNCFTLSSINVIKCQDGELNVNEL